MQWVDFNSAKLLDMKHDCMMLVHARTIVAEGPLSLLIGGDEMTELNRSNATTIAIPPNAFPDSNFSYVLNHYATSVLFQLAIPESVNSSEFNVIVDTEVIGFLIPEEPNVSNLSMPVTITLQSFRGRNGEVSTCNSSVFIFHSLSSS